MPRPLKGHLQGAHTIIQIQMRQRTIHYLLYLYNFYVLPENDPLRVETRRGKKMFLCFICGLNQCTCGPLSQYILHTCPCTSVLLYRDPGSRWDHDLPSSFRSPQCSTLPGYQIRKTFTAQFYANWTLGFLKQNLTLNTAEV
jgi:hypothetical protein